MTNLQVLLAMGVPTIMVLIGILLNRSDVASLRSEMVQLRVDLHHDMNTFRADINRDMTTLRDNIHRNMVSLHERVAVVEAKHE